jgi:hypothetical protein
MYISMMVTLNDGVRASKDIHCSNNNKQKNHQLNFKKKKEEEEGELRKAFASSRFFLFQLFSVDL